MAGEVDVRNGEERYIPRKADSKRRMLFLHGGSYVVYAPQDAVYRSLASRLAAKCRPATWGSQMSQRSIATEMRDAGAVH